MKAFKKYAHYTLLSLIPFLIVYLAISFIANDFFWISKFIETLEGRGIFTIIFLFTSLVSLTVVGASTYTDN